MKKLKLFSIAVLFLTYACQKEPVKSTVPTIPTTKEVIVNDPPLTSWHKDTAIHTAGDTSTGYITAIKNGKKWQASGNAILYTNTALSKKQLIISMYTFCCNKTNSDFDFLRESITFKAVNVQSNKQYIKSSSSNDSLSGKFGRLKGDVLWGLFRTDPNYNGFVELTKIDTVQKYIEGNFNADFLGVLPQYPNERIRLSNGKFRLKIQ